MAYGVHVPALPPWFQSRASVRVVPAAGAWAAAGAAQPASRRGSPSTASAMRGQSVRAVDPPPPCLLMLCGQHSMRGRVIDVLFTKPPRRPLPRGEDGGRLSADAGPSGVPAGGR